MNIIQSFIAFVTFLLLTSAMPSHAMAAPDTIAGNWHASLEIPTGKLSLIFTIHQDDAGTLSATLESPDQAPGQQIPISDISITDDHLSITIAIIGANIEADWTDEHGHWEGTFTQGINLPVIIKQGLPNAKPIIDGLDGTWRSTINRNGVDLRLIIHIETTDRGTIAKLDSPDTLNMNISVANLNRVNNQVSYTIPIISGQFEGTLDSPTTITGTWVVPNEEPLTITYIKDDEDEPKPQRNRPQVPTEPYSYIEEQVTFSNPLADNVTLAGTLTRPEGEGPFPAAILISGSGPQDRNETIFGHQPFLVLADHLTKQGIAVLRYDDRGVAQSTGDYHQANSSDFATDANAARDYLQSRPEINQDAIGFIGHSEGGLIAPLAMTQESLGSHTDHPIAFLIMLAGPGTSSKQVIQSQNALLSRSQGASEEEITRGLELNKKLIEAAVQADSTSNAEERIKALLPPEMMSTMGLTDANVTTIVSQFTSPWMRYFLSYDPANYLPHIESPILALNGELDLQVPAQENLNGLRTLLSEHDDATIIELSGLNHMFQTAVTGAMGEYNDIEETFAPEAMNMISEWIQERFNN